MFPVESVAAVRKQLTDRGCHLTGEPQEVAKGTWASTLTDPDGHRLALFGARLSSGSANRPYAALSVNDASVRVTSGKPAMVQSPQRRLIVKPRSWRKRVGYQQSSAAALVEKGSLMLIRIPFRCFIGAENQ